MRRHDYVQNNVPDDLVIWRYLTLPKLIWMLNERKLYFCRMDKLKDKAEVPITEKIARSFKQDLKTFEKNAINTKKTSFINCWIISEHEESLMWDTYAPEDSGVAIKTTVKNLMNSSVPDDGVYIGNVLYFDDKKESPQKGGIKMNWLYLPFAKRIFFEKENELRLLHDNENNDSFSLPVNLNTMIEKLVLSPSAPEYVKHLIKQLVTEKGFNFSVVDSELEFYS